jgi:hypothetical protein
MITRVDKETAHFAFDETIRELTLQQGWISDIRSRAGLILGVGSLSATFFGAKSIEAHQHTDGPTWAAVAAFLSMGLLVTLLFAPFGKWKFFVDDAVEAAVANDTELPDVLLHFAIENRSAVTSNAQLLDRCNRLLLLAAGLLVVEVAAFTWSFAL